MNIPRVQWTTGTIPPAPCAVCGKTTGVKVYAHRLRARKAPFGGPVHKRCVGTKWRVVRLRRKSTSVGDIWISQGVIDDVTAHVIALAMMKGHK